MAESGRELADAGARRRIEEELDRNLVVEAAAGAGKTHALVGRIVALVAAGECEIDEVAAVTFTRKAAGELRGRLLTRLETALEQADAGGEEAARLRRALGRFERAFAGTIHSFCARLLRERPVEAGVDPGFEEVDERDEARLRHEAWEDWIDREAARDSDRLRAVEELGVDVGDLLPLFGQLCDHPELRLPRERVPAPDLEPAVRRTVEFVEWALDRVPGEPVEDRHDRLQKTLFAARSFLRSRELDGSAERAAFLELFDGGTGVTQKLWGDSAVGKEVDGVFGELEEEVLEPALRRWREHAYPKVLDFVEPAVEHYAELRRRRGRMNFQDLLLRTAEMLRGHPEVRRHFGRRWSRILVDEFQDTDPLQAEILFLLTARDREETDWRRARPRPGSLFLVGDPKQSIYRFRRADLDVYRFVRDRVREGGGDVVTLTTSFRSLEPLVTWLNRSLAPAFREHGDDVQPEFVPLSPHRIPTGDPGPAVRRLELEKIPRNPAADVAEADARRIARWVRAAVDGEIDEAEEGGLLEGGFGPGDVLILLRQKKHLPVYARALEREGLPYEVSGGGAASESEELRALLRMARAALHPDDPVALAAHLRGPLAGISDDALYRFRRPDSGPRGVWDWSAYASGGRTLPDIEEADAFGRAFEGLARARRLLLSLAPAAALEILLEESGLLPGAAGREAGSSRAGSLYRVLSLVRGWQREGREIAWVLEELELLIEDDGPDVDEMVLETGRGDVVRVMNVHKAKGLQGRVVFLADPLKAPKPRVERHVERVDDDRPTGHFPAHRRNRFGRPTGTLAQPPGWEELEEREARHEAAEEDRLLYVAATRARDLLVVSRYPHPDRGPWTRLYPALEDVPELPVPSGAEGMSGSPGETGRPVPGAGDGRPPTPDTAALASRWEDRRAHSFAVERASGRVDDDPPVGVGAADPETARAWGTAVHRYLHRLVEGRIGDPGPVAERLLEEEGLDRARAEGLVDAGRRFEASELGRRVARSERVLAEIPLARWRDDAGPSTLLRGTVDLAFREEAGWVLVDHKTHPAGDEEARRALIARFRPQLDAYAAVWAEATGEPVAARGLWLVAPGTWRVAEAGDA